MISKHSPARPWHAPLTWLTRTLRGALQRHAQSQIERATVQSLSKLDDHQLNDIGLTRGDIRSAVAGRVAARKQPCVTSAGGLIGRLIAGRWEATSR